MAIGLFLPVAGGRDQFASVYYGSQNPPVSRYTEHRYRAGSG